MLAFDLYRPRVRPALTVVGAPPAARFGRWTPYLRAVAAYLAVRVLGVAMLAVMAAPRDLPLLERLSAWDGWWYLQIAERNYGGVPEPLDAAGELFPAAPMGFFPLYPGAMRVLGELGLPLLAAGLVVSTGAGVVAACGLQRIGERFGGQRVGLVLVVLWAGAPMSITQSMVYTESLFVALAAWSLVGVLERRFGMAAVCTMFAGLTRSTAVVLVAVVVVAAVLAATRGRGRDRWQLLGWAAIAPLGLAGYWGFVAARTGSLTGWQDIELRGWGVRWDWGREAAEYTVRLLTREGSRFETLVLFVTVAAVILGAVMIARRMPWPLVAYGIGVAVLAIGTAGFPQMRGRFLLPAFVLLLPVAVGLAKRRPSTAVAVAAAFVLFGCWYSAYSLTAWQHGI
ncbi:hypothetical protein [Amycolatopsis azurea]|uniref:Integral membrane protein n=1 Tax=Amycolatopsis azurea DSM 43854 TaxID=1238180 RepID=M2PF33_9PSEU|nr:hypothetical protein [Amycolatopsis azurea]EMD22938.1 hypothetical protein C791_7938 [Amycolatopsis azurea DSM 43854]OOC04300.1 hypothetical protein B0293_23890 [Amycolatopsis azurea DSM 43854]